jgi:three-Cys-motif partner protein
MTAVEPAYHGREQTAVKHRVLGRYLTPLPLIVGRTWARDIVHVDCCAGPWHTVTDDLSDSSIGIALRQLREAREILTREGRSVTFRCLFVEQDPTAYAQLKKYCDSVSDIEVKTLPGDFVAHIPEILRFVAARRDSFPFFFIDPTGWLPLKILPLKPLLQYQPGEVLINFMTSYIRRFLEEQGEDFGAILGERAMANIHGLVGQERDDAAAFAYADQIAQAGNFPYVCTTLVLNPQINQTYYHLIYATRHHKGVEVFKDAERNASEFMELARADAQQRHRIEITNIGELFAVEEYAAGNDYYLSGLRRRYLNVAHARVEDALRLNKRRPMLYDQAWRIACRFPLVWESDLHKWIKHEWRDKINVLGMRPNQRVPKCQSGHSLVWTA